MRASIHYLIDKESKWIPYYFEKLYQIPLFKEVLDEDKAVHSRLLIGKNFETQFWFKEKFGLIKEDVNEYSLYSIARMKTY